jgi:hypothetical protein
MGRPTSMSAGTHWESYNNAPPPPYPSSSSWPMYPAHSSQMASGARYAERPTRQAADPSLCYAPRIDTIPLPSQLQLNADTAPFVQGPSRLQLQVHPAVTYTGNRLHLCLDVSQGVSDEFTERAWRSTFSANGKSVLSHTVTDPALPSLTLVIPSVPWHIVVHHSLHPYVTLGDLFHTICFAFKQERRTSNGRHSTMLDWLGGKHIFMGLESIPNEESTFTVRFATRSRT